MKNDLQQKRRALTALYRSDFVAFARFASRQAIPTDRLIGDCWHADVLADALGKVLINPGSRLIINAPPGCFKSFIASVAFPAFLLARNPTLTVVVLAGDRAAAAGLHKRRAELMQMTKFQALRPRLRFEVAPGKIRTSAGGQITQEAVGYATSRDADIVIYSDPMSAFDAHDLREREKFHEQFRLEAVHRLKSGASGHIIVAMPRLHIDDLTASLLRSGKEWLLLSIPAIAVEDERWELSNGAVHVRRKGDVIDPRLADRNAFLETARDVGAMNFMAQYQQEPIANEFRIGRFLDKPFDRASWTPAMGLPRWSFRRVSELERICYELFGVGDPPPQPYTGTELTDEEWEAETVAQQARLIASSRA